MLKAKLSSNYRSKKGNTVFVFSVSGTATELAAYKAVQGVQYRESETKTPLFFSTSYIGDSVSLIITTNGKLVVDNSNVEKMTSLIKGTSGLLQSELAKLAAASIFGNLGGTPAPVAAPVAAIVNPETAEVTEIDNADLPETASTLATEEPAPF